MSSWSSRSSSNPAAGSWPWRTRHWYADGGGLSVGEGRSSLDHVSDIWNDRQVNDPGFAEADRTAVDDELSSSRGLRWVAAVLGLAVLAVGGVATFRSTNGAGSAALVVGGIALLVLGGLGDRIELLKVGNVEFHIRAAARQLIRRADELERQGDSAGAEQLREEARHLLRQASPAARRYEELRRTQPTGPQRTAELYKALVDVARQLSKDQHPSAEFVRSMFRSDREGERVFALVLMQEDPDTGDLASVLDAISRPRSAFEQYQALAAALEMLSRLDSSERERLASAIRQQLESGEWITPSTGRYSLAQRILSVTDQEELL